MRHADQTRDVSMAPRLGQHALARINQDNGQVGGAGSGHHIACVLLMAGRVADDEFAFGRGKVTIGHIYRNALLAFGLQAIGQQR